MINIRQLILKSCILDNLVLHGVISKILIREYFWYVVKNLGSLIFAILFSLPLQIPKQLGINYMLVEYTNMQKLFYNIGIF